MATPDIRRMYELLHRAMQQQSPPQQGAGFDSVPNAAPELYSYGSPQGGLPGRWLAPQEEQNSRQPFIGNNQLALSGPQDPNFRQLSRAPMAAQQQGTIAPFSRADDLQSSSSFQDRRNSSPDLLNASPYGAELSSAFEDKSSSPWFATPPAMTPIPVGWRFRGIPMPPMGPMSLPPIRMPAVPEWWKALGTILKLDPSSWLGEGRDGDYNRCIRAIGGTPEQWEEFCESIGPGQSNTVGGQSKKQACRRKTYESDINKNNWCYNEFGSD